MPENLKHTPTKARKTQRNGVLIGGYVREDVAAFIRAKAKEQNATVSKFLNTHFQKLLNAESKNGK